MDDSDLFMIEVQPEAEAAAAESGNDACVYCGKVHPNSIWGRIVAFFHTIFWFFTRLFKK